MEAVLMRLQRRETSARILSIGLISLGTVVFPLAAASRPVWAQGAARITDIQKPPDGANSYRPRESVSSIRVLKSQERQRVDGHIDMPLNFQDEIEVRQSTQQPVHKVYILYNDPSRKEVKLAPGALVRLVDKETLQTEQGILAWIVGKIRTTTKYIQAIAPGTQYAIEVSGEQSRVFVWEGEVQVTNRGPNPATVAVREMHMTETIGPNQPSTPRVPSFDEVRDLVLFGVDLDPVIRATVTDETLRQRVHEDLVRALFESRTRRAEVGPQINLGNVYLFLGKNEEALRAFEEAERISPRPAEIYNGRGIALARLGRYAEAVAAFEQAVSRDKDSKFYNNLGNLYLLRDADRQTLQSAFAAYDQALERDKLNAAPYNGRGVAELVRQAIGEAERAFAESVQLKDRAVSRSNLGNAYLLQDNLPAARTEYDRAIQLDPTDAAALNNRGVARLKARDFQSAKADFEAAVRASPRDSSPYVGLGIAQVGLKELDQAVAAFIQSIQLEANRNAYRNLAYLYLTEESVRGSIESRLQAAAAASTNLQSAVDRFLEFLRTLPNVSGADFEAAFEKFQPPAGTGR
jgi:Flp pilus assembly protein TadD